FARDDRPRPSRAYASAALEYPDVVQVAAGSTDLFHGSKTAAGVEQFVSKNDLHLAIRALNSRTDYERLPLPAKLGRRGHALLRAGDFATVCLKLEFVLHRIGLAFKYGLVSKCRVTVLDSHVTAPDRGGGGAESTCLSIQGPFAGKVRLSLRKP